MAKGNKTTIDLELLLLTDDPIEIFAIHDERSLEYMIFEIEKVIRRSNEYRG
jgi:hypothetical protein